MYKFIFLSTLFFLLLNQSFCDFNEEEIPENLADDDGDDSSEQVQEIKDSPYAQQNEEDGEEEKEDKQVARSPSIIDIKMASIAFGIALIFLILLWVVVLHITGYNKIKFPKRKKVIKCGNNKKLPLLRNIEAPARSQDPLNDVNFTAWNQKYNEATKLLWTNNKLNTLSDKSSNSNGSNPRY